MPGPQFIPPSYNSVPVDESPQYIDTLDKIAENQQDTEPYMDQPQLPEEYIPDAGDALTEEVTTLPAPDPSVLGENGERKNTFLI